MTLKHFFDQIKASRLDETSKNLLYQKIVRTHHLNQRPLFMRLSFLFKVSVYSLFVFILTLIVYPGILPQHSFLARYDWFFVEQSLKNGSVMADYVGTIVSFQWNFQLLHKGNLVSTDRIYDGDTIILLTGSEIVFDIDRSHRASVSWPAEFRVLRHRSQTGLNYVLQLIRGEYIVLQSLDQNDQSDESMFSWDYIVSLQTEQFTVKASSRQHNHIVIDNRGHDKIIENKGQDIVIERTVGKKTVVDIVQNNRIVSLNDESLDLKQFASALNNRSLWQTTILDHDIDTGLLASLSQQPLDLSWTSQTKKSDYTLLSVPDQRFQWLLDGILYRQFLRADFVNYAHAYLNATSAYDSSYQVLVGKFLQLGEYNAQNVQRSSRDPKQLVILLKAVRDDIYGRYFLPDRYRQEIDYMIRSLEQLWRYEYGQFRDENIAFDDVLSTLGIVN